MAFIGQTGLRYCGIGWYGAADTDWNLLGTSGVRTWATNITFPSAFSTTPSVQVMMAGFNILDSYPHKFNLGVANVSTTGFQLQINTWDDAQVAGVTVVWIGFTN